MGNRNQIQVSAFSLLVIVIVLSGIIALWMWKGALATFATIFFIGVAFIALLVIIGMTRKE